jgi:hypothetical protein
MRSPTSPFKTFNNSRLLKLSILQFTLRSSLPLFAPWKTERKKTSLQRDSFSFFLSVEKTHKSLQQSSAYLVPFNGTISDVATLARKFRFHAAKQIRHVDLNPRVNKVLTKSLRSRSTWPKRDEQSHRSLWLACHPHQVTCHQQVIPNTYALDSFGKSAHNNSAKSKDRLKSDPNREFIHTSER